jgi:hypothetical protein
VDQGPDELRNEIEQTRQRLGSDVDALTEKVSPAKVAQRRVDAAKSGVNSLKEKVMGGGSDAAHSASGVASHAGEKVSGVAGSVTGSASSAAQGLKGAASSAPGAAVSRAEGNPLAAGLIAFGVGWLASSLLPASQKEQQAAGRLTETAKANMGPVKQMAGQAAGELKESLQPSVQQAVESVRSTATDAAATVQQEAKDATGTVKEEAQGAAQEVKESRESGSSGSTTSGGPTSTPTPAGGTGAW